jgi:tetratricopeptide (TPR) repeat protein
MKFARFIRAFLYLSLVGCTPSMRMICAQQPSASPATKDTSDPNLRNRFTQSGATQAELRAGLLRGQAGDFAGAIKDFQHVLEVHPNSAEAHYNLGLALLASGGNIPVWKDALVQFQAAVALEPDYAQARHMAGVALLESGDPGKAITELKRATSLNPSFAEAHFDLGRALASTGDVSGADAEYLAALKLKSPYPDAEYAVGKALLGQRQNAAAIQHFRAALLAQPDFESAHYGLAQALKADGKTEESKAELNAASLLLQRQSDAVMSSHLSNESLDRAKQGDMQAAIDLAREALWLNPANALANFNLGLLLADSGNLPASIHEIRKAISLAPYQIAFYLDLTRVQQKAGDQEGAAATLDRAKQIDPSDPGLIARLGKNAGPSTATGSVPSGTSANSEQFLFGAPSDTADGHFAFAIRLSEEGDFLGALGEMRQALVLSPTRSDVRYGSAIAATQIGRHEEAEYELRNVLRLTPGSVPARLALGSLLFERKDLAGAAEEFREVLRIQPANPQALKLLRECGQNSSQ